MLASGDDAVHGARLHARRVLLCCGTFACHACDGEESDLRALAAMRASEGLERCTAVRTTRASAALASDTLAFSVVCCRSNSVTIRFEPPRRQVIDWLQMRASADHSHADHTHADHTHTDGDGFTGRRGHDR